MARQRAEARAEGGRLQQRQVKRAELSVKPLKVGTPAAAVDALARVAGEVWAGKLDPRSANSISMALSAVLQHRAQMHPELEDLWADSGVAEVEFDEEEDAAVAIRKDGRRARLTAEQTAFLVKNRPNDDVTITLPDEEPES